MDRRFFVYQLATGAAMATLPTTLVAQVSTSPVLKQQSGYAALADLIGAPRQLVVSYVYHTQYTSLTELRALVARDFDQINRWLQVSLPTAPMDWPDTDTDTRLGSYNAQLQQNGLLVQWQCLARHGGQPQPPSSTLRVLTDTAILQPAPGAETFELLTFQGERLGYLPRTAQLICPSADRLV